MIRAQSVAYLAKNQKLRPKAAHPLGEPGGKLKINENWINRQLFPPIAHALVTAALVRQIQIPDTLKPLLRVECRCTSMLRQFNFVFNSLVGVSHNSPF